MISDTDFLVIGGGVVGLSIALSLKQQWSDARIVLLEKESDSINHGSGRNSGVIHAGFYYSPDSLKARLTREGNQRLRQFCEDRRLPILNTGKVVVANNETQLEALDVLYQRGLANGVDLEMIDEKRLSELEPLARTTLKALWSPNTAVADPQRVTHEIRNLAEISGVEINYNEEFISYVDGLVTTNTDRYRANHIVNCAGLYADRVANHWGYCDDYMMLPFIGLYAYAPRLQGSLTRHVYPVPDPRNPFLGVHATVTVNQEVKIGPTAIPALSREAYRALRDLEFTDLSEIIRTYPKFLTSPHHNVFRLISSELPKYSRTWLVHQARKLVPSLKRTDFTLKGRPGIRAQLFDLKNKKLEMDFVVRGDDRSTHILNAVSPAWTSCFSFADYVVEDISQRIS